MEKLIELLNDKTENKYNFMLKSALFEKSADFCMIEILYKDGQILNLEIKEFLLNEIFNVLPKDIKYEIKFIKNFVSEERIKDEFKEFMNKTFPSISYKLESVLANGTEFCLKVLIDELSFEHAKKKSFALEVEKYFKNMFKENDFSCDFESGTVFVEDEMELLKKNYREEEVDIYENRIINFFDALQVIGDEIDEPASYAKDKTEEQTGVVLCGKVSNFGFRVINTKRKKTEDTESSDENLNAEEETQQNEEPKKTEYQKKLFKWTLTDFTGEMKCVFMSNKENQSKIEKIDNDSVIAVRGNLIVNKYSGDLEMQVRDLSYCSIPENLVEYIDKKLQNHA